MSRERPWSTADALRIMRAVGREIADGDPDGLGDIKRLQDELDRLTGVAVERYRRAGFTDAQIGAELGVTKQAVQKRWSRQRQVVD